MRKITDIVVHCADTPKGKYFDINDIYQWHVVERGWSDIGYHYVILLDGTIQLGRDIKTVGAHVKGFNSKSIGICYIGGKGNVDTRTTQQKVSLVYLVGSLKRMFKKAKVSGHRDFPNVKKYCPSFDAKHEYKNL